MGKYSSHTPIHDRLYNEVFQTLERKREYEKISQQMQLQGCKFIPSISKLSQSFSRPENDFGDRLSKQVMEGKKYQGKSTFDIEAEKAQ